MFKKFFASIEKWWEGKWVEREDRLGIFAISGRMERPLIVSVLIGAGRFWVKHWRFILMFLVGFAGAIAGFIAALR